MNRSSVRRRIFAYVALGAVTGIFMVWWTLLRMPGKSFRGPLEPLDERGRELAGALKGHVNALAAEIGERNVTQPKALEAAEKYVSAELERSGLKVEAQSYRVGSVECKNLEVELRGSSRANEIVVVGAHYDSVIGTPGADDNATGTAALIELQKRFATGSRARTLRFVAFVNEEPPHFQTSDMGSVQYARRSRERGENVVAMLSLESIGYYSSESGSQHYPPPLGFFYPSTGDFIAFVGNPASRKLVHRVVERFRSEARFPSEGAALPAVLPGVGWSDQWAFWQQGYPALMVTDTAPFRNPHYHQSSDTPERVDYERLARVVSGLESVIADLASGA